MADRYNPIHLDRPQSEMIAGIDGQKLPPLRRESQDAKNMNAFERNDPPGYSEATSSTPPQPSLSASASLSAHIHAPAKAVSMPLSSPGSAPPPGTATRQARNVVSTSEETTRVKSMGGSAITALTTCILTLIFAPFAIVAAVLYGTGKFLESIGRGLTTGSEMVYRAYRTEGMQRALGREWEWKG